MWYSVPGVIALLVILIIDFDVITRNRYKHNIPALGAYRLFIFALLSFFIVDALWGVLDDFNNYYLEYTVTVFYFLGLAFALFSWTRFVTRYVGKGRVFGHILNGFGYVFIAIMVVALIINFFYPIVFYFDTDGVYHAGILRYVAMIIQIVLFLFTAVYSFIIGFKNETGLVKQRFVAVGASTFTMILIAIMQFFLPLLPIYTIAFLISACLIHTFVLQGEIQEHQQQIESALSREQKQKEELISANLKAYTDALTGVKSMLAYIEMNKSISRRIDKGTLDKFGLIVFDLNDLKVVNDTLGHEAGDEFIKNSSQLICTIFKRSPVYRIGGDEFVAIIEGNDFDKRDELLAGFNSAIENNIKNNSNIVVAAGLGVYQKGKDKSFRAIFNKADRKMYERKEELKKLIREK